MAGNTINVQGNYIDVHDNEVVNLNIGFYADIAEGCGSGILYAGRMAIQVGCEG